MTVEIKKNFQNFGHIPGFSAETLLKTTYYLNWDQLNIGFPRVAYAAPHYLLLAV